MGWKASLIIIESRNNFSDEKAILKALGKEEFEFSSETTLEECVYPNDNSINIGSYNGNIVICDDYQITNGSLERAKSLALTKEEKRLVELFPDSEIVMVACHSGVNYHGYSLIQNGKKIRLKTVTSDDALKEFGERTIEEEHIYNDSYKKHGKNYWKDESDPESEYSEDQLMSEFTFGFAKRRLGVVIDHTEGDELMSNTPFKKFVKPNTPTKIKIDSTKKKNYKWLPYIMILALLIIWQVLKRTVLKN